MSSQLGLILPVEWKIGRLTEERDETNRHGVILVLILSGIVLYCIHSWLRDYTRPYMLLSILSTGSWALRKSVPPGQSHKRASDM